MPAVAAYIASELKALRITQRRTPGDHAARRRSHHVRALGAEVIEELDEIEREPLVRQSAIRTGLRLAVAADVRTHDAILAREMRHPAEEAQRAAEAGMQQHDERRFLPRIGEVVVPVMKLRAVAGSPVRCVRHLEPSR